MNGPLLPEWDLWLTCTNICNPLSAIWHPYPYLRSAAVLWTTLWMIQHLIKSMHVNAFWRIWRIGSLWVSGSDRLQRIEESNRNEHKMSSFHHHQQQTCYFSDAQFLTLISFKMDDAWMHVQQAINSTALITFINLQQLNDVVACHVVTCGKTWIRLDSNKINLMWCFKLWSCRSWGHATSWQG